MGDEREYRPLTGRPGFGTPKKYHREPTGAEARQKRVIATCRSCGAQIVWLKTKRGKNIPVDLKRIDGGSAAEDVDRHTFDRDRHVTHFETCPNADRHRKREDSDGHSRY